MHMMLRALKREGEGVRKESTLLFRPVFWIYDIWRIYFFKLFFLKLNSMKQIVYAERKFEILGYLVVTCESAL